MEQCWCGNEGFDFSQHEYVLVTPTGEYKKATDKLSVGVCKKCGTQRQMDLPYSTKEEMRDYYAQYPPTDPRYRVKDLSHDRELARIRCEEYGIFPGEEKMLLDIGSGSGAFVEECRHRGARAFGCELAQYNGAVAKEFTYFRPFEEIHFPTDHFDIVVIHDVLEHVLDPLAFMKEVVRVVKFGGDIWLDLPNAFATSGKHHWKKEHIWYFDEYTIGRLCESAGLVVEQHSAPIPSKLLFKLSKPYMERTTILVPPGIGDSYWSICKLEAFLKRENLGLPDVSVVCPRSKRYNGHQRAFPFLELFPFLHASWDAVDAQDKQHAAIWKEAYAQEGRTIFRNVLGHDYFISYNGHLRVGKELDNIDPDLATDWHPPMWQSLEQDAFQHQIQQRAGKYIVFYFVFVGTYVYWTREFPLKKVILAIQNICARTGCAPIFAGGRWDADDQQLTEVKSAVPNAIDLIGKTSVQQLFGLLQGAELVVGYPSGLTIMSAAMGVKTLCLWNDYYNRDFFWNAVPPDVRGKTYFIDYTRDLKVNYLTQRTVSIVEEKAVPMRKLLSTSSPSVVLRAPKVRMSGDEAPSFTVACVLKSGGDFTEKYVHNLVAAVRRHSPEDINIVCLTDMNITGDFRIVKLQDNLPGWWSKIELFRTDITDKKHIVYFDLDTLIVGDISPFFSIVDTFAALRPWNSANRAKGYCASGIMVFNREKMNFIYSDFLKNHDRNQDIIGGDQAFISMMLGKNKLKYQPIQDKIQGIYSFKRHCRNELPKDARVVCFHGNPRPHRVVDISWVKEHWR